MFEDFSFLSSSSTITADPHYVDYNCIDPLQPVPTLSAQFPSPTSPYFPPQCSQTRDMRYHGDSRSSSMDSSLASSSRRMSIDTLTSHFDNHAPFESSSTSSTNADSTPRSAPVDDDEGFVDASCSDQQPSYTTTFDYSLSCAPLKSLDCTSTSTSAALMAHSKLYFTNRRRQRQLLSRLQTLSSLDSLDTKLLLDDCHPSSLPPDVYDPNCNSEESRHDGKPALFSITGTDGFPIAFTRASTAGRRGAVVKRAPRLRKRKA